MIYVPLRQLHLELLLAAVAGHTRVQIQQRLLEGKVQMNHVSHGARCVCVLCDRQFRRAARWLRVPEAELRDRLAELSAEPPRRRCSGYSRRSTSVIARR